jgi:hypothetical protein
MMDFHAKTVEERDRMFAQIGELAYKRYMHCQDIEHAEQEIREIDIGIAEREGIAKQLDQVLRNFDTYLAVKEGAITLDMLKDGIEAGGDPDIGKQTGASVGGETPE